MSIAQLITDAKTNFNALPAAAAGVQAFVGDRITVMNASGKPADVLVVKDIKTRILKTESLVTHKSVSLGVKEFDADGVLLDNDTTVQLFKSTTPPKPGRKGSKKVVGAPTKLSICTKIFLENPNMEKSEMCKLFQSEANCTRMGANTYYILISKNHPRTAN